MVITLLMVLALFPTNVFANDSNYEPRLTAPSSSNSYYNSTLNVYSQTGYGMPNCTAYAFGRAYEITGKRPLIDRGNAGEWWYINKSNNYYKYGSTPKLGAIACWDRYDCNSGHVAIVEKNNDGNVTLSESRYQKLYFTTYEVNSDGSDYGYGYRFLGYIYVSDGSNAEKQAAKKKAQKKEKEEKSKNYKMEAKMPTAKIEAHEVFDSVKLQSTNVEKPIENAKLLISASESTTLTA